MSRRERKLAARAEASAVAREREDLRLQSFVRSMAGPAPGFYSGRTPATVDGVPTFRGRGAGGCGRVRLGHVERTRKGTLKLRALPGDPGAPKHGGANMPAGMWLEMAEDGSHYVASGAVGRLSDRAGDVTPLEIVVHGEDAPATIDRVAEPGAAPPAFAPAPPAPEPTARRRAVKPPRKVPTLF